MDEGRVCARCGTANVGRDACVACDAPLSASPEPSAGRVEPDVGVPVASFEAPPSRSDTGPNVVGVVARSTAGAPATDTGGPRRGGLIAALIVLALVAGVSTALVFNRSPRTDPPPEVASGGAGIDSRSTASTGVSETGAAPAVSTQPVAPEGGPGTSGDAPATAPSVSAPGPTVDTSAWETFLDARHVVHLVLPPDLDAYDAFDGTSARWVGNGATVFYEVEPYATVADADARANALRSSLVGAVYESRGKSESHQQDGRYVVSGQVGADGTYLYERGRIRCGDLVRYRLQWSDQGSKPFIDLLTKAWVNAQPDLDAMGGVQAACEQE